MGCGTSFVKYVLFFFNLVVAVLVALFFYATGSYQRPVGVAKSLSQKMCSVYIQEVTQALIRPEVLKKYISFPKTRAARQAVSSKFFTKYGIPGVVGCVDGSHFKIFGPPKKEEHLYYCRKHYHSINVQMLLGLAVIGVGVAFLLNWTPIKQELQSHLTVAPWVFIVIGAIMFVIAFFGCCGAIRESHCMVVTYAIFLLVIIIMQVILAVLLFTYGESIKDGLKKGVDGLWNKRAHDPATNEIFNNIQTQLKCCGNSGAFDYGGIALDKSCCNTEGTVGQIVGCTVANAYTGCRDKIGDLYEQWNKPIAGIAIGIACIEVVGALFSLCLANSIRNMDRRYV